MPSSSKKAALVGCSVFGFFAATVIVWLAVSAFEAYRSFTTGGYQVGWRKVDYYQKGSGYTLGFSWEVEGADALSFKVLENGYAKDKNHAYFDGYVIPQSDGKTFKVIRSPYAADQNHVFYGKEAFSDAPEQFKFVQYENDFSTDGETIFYNGKALFPGRLDAATFQRIGGSDYYKDKNTVLTLEKIVEGADPETFESIPYEKNLGDHRDIYYAKDKQSVFYEGVKVEGCDPKTHQIIDSTTHRDARHVFIKTEKVGDDAANFKNFEGNYSKDGKNVYWKSIRIEGANAANFKVFETTYGRGYGTDGKHIYWCAQKFDRADVATFVGLNGDYGKDKNHVWYGYNPDELPQIVENADVATFEIYAGGGRDKNSYFDYGRFKYARPSSE